MRKKPNLTLENKLGITPSISVAAGDEEPGASTSKMALNPSHLPGRNIVLTTLSTWSRVEKSSMVLRVPLLLASILFSFFTVVHVTHLCIWCDNSSIEEA